MERLLKTPFCSALDPSVYWIQCAFVEFSYFKYYTALLGCRRSCFALVETVCQPTELTEARTATAKPSGQLLYGERFSLLRTKLRLAYTAWEVRVSVVPDFRLYPFSEIGCLYFVSWDRLNGYAQTHQKSPKN